MTNLTDIEAAYFQLRAAATRFLATPRMDRPALDELRAALARYDQVAADSR
jgi:hypothetical protein